MSYTIVSPLITPIVVPSVTPFEEFRPSYIMWARRACIGRVWGWIEWGLET